MKRELGLSISRPAENVFACGLFSCIEFSIGAKFNEEGAFEIWEERAAQVKDLCKKHGVRLHSYHIPFNGERYQGVYMHDPSSLNPIIREQTLAYTKRQIEFLADSGLSYVVLHGSLRVSPEERSARVDFFVEYLRRLCDFCAPLGITVAVETLLESCIGGGGDDPKNRIPEMRYIMEKTNRKNLGVCLDNNHFILSDCLDFVKELGQYVVTTHFSDYDGVQECHRFPGEGITDWKELTRLLIEKGYRGPWLFEVKFQEKGNPMNEELSQLVNGWRALTSEF